MLSLARGLDDLYSVIIKYDKKYLYSKAAIILDGYGFFNKQI
jgi:hypothetical protein